ncbi:OmpA/MotB family protein [Salidesulfovibrio onnuriiensis]|uniref:OmpA/MotB family protein n=1 Tax=Salidesulfovibrio onnuriiensis TaxID=2583823 RepID=UPI0011CC5BBF|nr:flagellar motor protein MotB [Salidesulfovibrio onnuriiensis]
MGKKKKPEKCPPLALWLVTFSDLTTLLLTFFVLLLTMSSMDNSILTTVTLTTADLGLLERRGSGRVTATERLIAELMEKPWEVVDKKNRIKDLLYPEDTMPPELNRATLDENVEILARNDGVALVITDGLLFEEGQRELSPAGKYVVDQLIPVISYMSAPVNLIGYADTQEPGVNPYEISEDRALSVLGYMVEKGIGQKRFTLSAYGNDRPRYTGDNPALRAKNRRVEILLKTNRPIGSYP